MKPYLVALSRYVFPILAIGSLFFVAPLRSTQASAVATPVVPTLIDEFNGTSLDLNKWAVFSGNPSVVNGKLTLAGSASTRAEIQSLKKFGYGVLQMVITSSHWKPQNNQSTDSSFGFEIWQGTNGLCHYSVILKANGHLGLMRPQPDSAGNCTGNPKFQAHIPISDWDTIRAGKTVRLTLTWAPTSVTLHISSGNINDGIAYYIGTAEPTNRLEIRLNADYGETFRIDYVRVVGIPWR